MYNSDEEVSLDESIEEESVLEEYEEEDAFKEYEEETEALPNVESSPSLPSFSYHYLSGIITFILLPHFWCLSIPALIFSGQSKKWFSSGNVSLSIYFSNLARRFIIVSWLLTAAILIFISMFVIVAYLCL